MAQGNWEAIVVGGGPSGLGIGAMLAKAGKKVLLLEKEKYLGGRATYSSYKGHVLDNGPHAAILTGDLEEVYSRIGKEFPKTTPMWNKTEIYLDHEWKDLGKMFPANEMREIISEILKTSYQDLQDNFDDISLKDWLESKTSNEAVRYFLWYFGGAVCAEGRLDSISAGDLMGAIKKFVGHFGNFSGHAGTFIGGMRSLLEPLADTIRENGGEIKTGAKVSQVVIENGKVSGVEVEVGEKVIPSQILDTELIRAPVVVVTLPLWDLFTVLCEDEFPVWYVDWVKGIAPKIANVWSVMYGLDEPVFDEFCFRWIPELPRTKIGAWPMHYATLGQSVGQYQLSCLIQASYDQVPLLFDAREAKTRKDINQWFDLFEQDMEEVLPNLKEHTVWKIRQAAVYSITEAPGFVGGHRPHIKVPGVANLYLSSDTVRDARIGCIPAAAVAMLKCADMILAK